MSSISSQRPRSIPYGRGMLAITRPVRALTRAMSELATGNMAVETDFTSFADFQNTTANSRIVILFIPG